MATVPLAKDVHEERPITTYNGFLALLVGLLLIALAAYLFFTNVRAAHVLAEEFSKTQLVLTIAFFILGILVLMGLYTLQPNEAAIVQLFGDYRGTTRTP